MLTTISTRDVCHIIIIITTDIITMSPRFRLGEGCGEVLDRDRNDVDSYACAGW